MHTYQTGIMTGKQCDDFYEWFDREIGTDYEIDQDGEEFTLSFFELEKNEVAKIRRYENKMNPATR